MKAIAVGADDAAVHLKGVIAQYLKHRGIPAHDYGIFDDETVLYPDIALAVAQAVAEGKHDKGIFALRNRNRSFHHGKQSPRHLRRGMPRSLFHRTSSNEQRLPDYGVWFSGSRRRAGKIAR